MNIETAAAYIIVCSIAFGVGFWGQRATIPEQSNRLRRGRQHQEL